MNDLTQLVDHAAQQSDRWALYMLIGLMIIGFIAFARWMIRDREKVANRLTEVTDRHIAAMAELSRVVANNTDALNRVEKKL